MINEMFTVVVLGNTHRLVCFVDEKLANSNKILRH